LIDKTGWTPEQISNINLETLKILIDSWTKENHPKDDKGTPEKLMQVQSILKGFKEK